MLSTILRGASGKRASPHQVPAVINMPTSAASYRDTPDGAAQAVVGLCMHSILSFCTRDRLQRRGKRFWCDPARSDSTDERSWADLLQQGKIVLQNAMWWSFLASSAAVFCSVTLACLQTAFPCARLGNSHHNLTVVKRHSVPSGTDVSFDKLKSLAVGDVDEGLTVEAVKETNLCFDQFQGHVDEKFLRNLLSEHGFDRWLASIFGRGVSGYENVLSWIAISVGFLLVFRCVGPVVTLHFICQSLPDIAVTVTVLQRQGNSFAVLGGKIFARTI